MILASLLLSAISLPPIDSLTIQGADPFMMLHIKPAITLREGEKPTEKAIQETFQLLLSTGWVEEVSLEREGGNYILKILPTPKVEAISFIGAWPLPPKEILKALGLHEGFRIHQQTLRGLKSRLMALLEERGFSKAPVEVLVNPGKTPQGIRLTFHILWKTRPVIQSLHLTPEIQKVCAKPFRLKGKAYLPPQVESRLEKCLQTFWQSGHMKAHLSYKVQPLKTGGYDLTVLGEDLAKVTIAFKGDPLPRSIRKIILRHLSNHGYKPGAFEALLKQQLEKKIQSKGFFEAHLEAQWVEKNLLQIFFYRGVAYRSWHWIFQGITFFQPETIISFLNISKKRIPTPGVLKEWENMLKRFYQDHGFPDVRVKIEGFPQREAGRLKVVFKVEEGKRLFIQSIQVEGYPSELPKPTLSLQEGAPWNPSQVAQALRSLQAELAQAGFRDNRIELVGQRENQKVFIHFKVKPGRRFHLASVLFENLFTVNPHVLKRQIRRGSHPWLSPQKLMEIQSNLYETGLFRSVELVTLPGQEDPSKAWVVAQVEEDWHRSYQYGIGYDTEDGFRLQGGIAFENLYARRHYASLFLRWSQRAQEYRFIYRWPNWFATLYPLTFSTFRSRENWIGFDLKRKGSFIEYFRMIGSYTRLGLRYEYTIQETFNVEDEATIPREQRSGRVSGFGFSYVYDTRPQPLFPLKGSMITIEVKHTFPLWFADAEFTRWFFQGVQFFPIRHRSTFGISLRYGGIRPYGEGIVPIGERFFAGGRNSHRAFDRDKLGREGETMVNGVPVGGYGLFLLNGELRLRFTHTLGGTMFVDLGNVFKAYQDIRWGDLRLGYGVGVFVLTPIGPLRFDYAWKHQPEPRESPTNWFLSLGFTF